MIAGYEWKSGTGERPRRGLSQGLSRPRHERSRDVLRQRRHRLRPRRRRVRAGQRVEAQRLDLVRLSRQPKEGARRPARGAFDLRRAALAAPWSAPTSSRRGSRSAGASVTRPVVRITPVVARSYDPARDIWRPIYGDHNSGLDCPTTTRLDVRRHAVVLATRWNRAAGEQRVRRVRRGDERARGTATRSTTSTTPTTPSAARIESYFSRRMAGRRVRAHVVASATSMVSHPLRSSLIVDDEPLARARARRLLDERRRRRASSAKRAPRAEARAIASPSTAPDLLLLDIQMPGEDGFALLREPRPDDRRSCSSPPSITTPCARSRRTRSTTCSSRSARSGWPRRSTRARHDLARPEELVAAAHRAARRSRARSASDGRLERFTVRDRAAPADSQGRRGDVVRRRGEAGVRRHRERPALRQLHARPARAPPRSAAASRACIAARS